MNKKFHRFIVAVSALSVFVASYCLAATVIPSSSPEIIDTCGEGLLLDVSGQSVLVLSGSHYQMGFQQGRLLKTQVRELTERILDIVRVAETSGIKGFTHGSIEEAYRRTKDFIDERFHDEMRGLADGAQMPLKDVQLANIFPELFHCSGFALFDSATAGGTLLHGRILDYMTEVGLQDYAVVTVALPQGYKGFVNVGYAGFLGSVTGMNTAQIAIGEMGGKGEGDWDGMPMSFLLRKALEEASTLEQAVAIFRDTPRTCKYYYVVSDAKIPDARGLACTPEKFEIVEPGASHELLPSPVEDTVLLSSGDRYTHLARLVKERKGDIDIDYALKLMDKPVAMNSCLHQVLFEPKGQNLWVSNAVNPVETNNYAAFHQPYYHYNLTELISFAKSQGLNNEKIAAKPPVKPSDYNDRAAAQAELAVIEGVVGLDTYRHLPKSTDVKQQQLLERFEAKPQQFAYKLEPLTSTGKYNIFQASFPTEYIADADENNTIYCEYYDVIGEHKRPAVIILDIMDGSMMVSRIIANSLANNGINAGIMTLPYYGKRRPQDTDASKLISRDFDFFIECIEQSVIDVRTTARWLRSLDNVDGEQIGICGTSLGGFIAALSAGVDGRFNKAAFILAGGDLAAVLTTNEKEVRFITQQLKERGYTSPQLSELLKTIEPLSYADRLKNTDILMVNGTEDNVVPPQCAKLLAEAADAQIIWHPADHYSVLKYLLAIIDSVNKHFTP